MFNLRLAQINSISDSTQITNGLFSTSVEDSLIVKNAINTGLPVHVLIRTVTKTYYEIYLRHSESGWRVGQPIPGYNIKPMTINEGWWGKTIAQCFRITPRQGKAVLLKYINELLMLIETQNNIKFQSNDINIVFSDYVHILNQPKETAPN